MQENWLLLLGGASVVQGPDLLDEAKEAGYKILLTDTEENLRVFGDRAQKADEVVVTNHYDDEAMRDLLARYPYIKRSYAFREKLQFVNSKLNILLDSSWTRPATIMLIQNKYLCRELLRKCGISQPEAFLCYSASDVEEKLRIHFSGHEAILKPVTDAGSRGVYSVCSDNIDNIIPRLPQKGYPFILEEKVEGKEYSLEALFVGKKFRMLNITEKFLFAETFFEQGHVNPAGVSLDEQKKRQARALVESACKVIGIEYGMIHAEFWDTDAGIILGEIHNRVGGDFISVMAAETAGINVWQSQLTDTLCYKAQKKEHMAVWSERKGVSRPSALPPDLDQKPGFVGHAYLGERNLLCAEGASYEEALNNAKSISKLFNI
ncbi:acetyl-CoA carboxylase biotin carboxylase subunit family protein [Rahnella perminowiae]|uniref:ATP-grasp domain-containing protein n=2 Tax=Yersiniaceae TaxID=1903411 RepID=UPI001021517F|nr:ATP-grasp domain-containing protein [Rahnella sp. RFA10(1/100)]